MDWLLDKKDQEKMQLLRVVYREHDQYMTIQRLMTQLQWSRYLIIDVVGRLAEDLSAEYGMTKSGDPILQVSADKKGILLTYSRQINPDAFMLKYLAQSLTWQFVVGLFNETITSYAQFAEDNLTTVGSTRNIKATVETELAVHHIRLDEQYRLIGDDEMAVRLFFMRLAVRYFSKLDILFTPKVISYATDVATPFLSDVLGTTNFRDTKRLSTLFHFAIQGTRVEHGHYSDALDANRVLQPTDDLAGQTQLLLEKGVSVLQNLTHAPVEVAEMEVRETLLYLYTSDLIGQTDWRHNVTEDISSKINVFSKNLNRVYRRFFGYDVTPQVLQAIEDRMVTPIVTYTLFPYDSGVRQKFELTDAQRLYPIAYDITSEIIVALAEVLKSDLAAVRRFFFSHIFTNLVSFARNESLYDPIIIQIDINYRPGLEDMLKYMISGMVEFNVSFTTQYSEEVDIVISDSYKHVVDRESVFDWSMLPNAKQVEQLRNRLSQLKLTKFRKKFPTLQESE